MRFHLAGLLVSVATINSVPAGAQNIFQSVKALKSTLHQLSGPSMKAANANAISAAGEQSEQTESEATDLIPASALIDDPSDSSLEQAALIPRKVQTFDARENTAALIQHEEIRAAAGQRGADPLFGQVPELASLTNHAGHDRVDAPAPPPQSAPRAKPQPRGYAPPKRDPDFGTASTAHLTRPNMIDERSESSEAPQTRRSRWDFDDEGENDGQQPVAENSGQVPRQVAPNSPSAPRAGAASTTNDVLPTEHAGDDVGDDDEPNEDGFDEDYEFDRTRDDDEDEKDDD